MKPTQEKLISSWPFLLGLILGFYFLFLPVIGTGFEYFPGDLGDARFNNYLLEHAHLFFTGQAGSFWDAPFIYPEENIITYSDNLVGTAPLYSIFRLAGYDTLTSFQFWVILMVLLNYTCSFYFLKSVFKNRYAAVLGAFIFTFSIALQSQMTHAQMFPRFFIPLAIWMCVLFMKELKPIYFFAALFFVVLQFYAGIYLGFMLAVPITIMLFLTLFVFKLRLFFEQIKSTSWVLKINGIIIINFLLLAFLMWPYYEHAQLIEIDSYASIIDTVPTIRSFFYSPAGSLIWDSLSTTGQDYPWPFNHQIFPGVVSILSFLLALILFFFKKKSPILAEAFSPKTVLLLITGSLVFILFIRFQGFSFYKLIYSLPGFGSMRSITRIINIELIFFAISMSFIATIIFSRYKKMVIPVFLFLLTILVIDNYLKKGVHYRVHKQEAQNRVEVLRSKMKSIPEGSIVSYEPGELEFPSYVYQLDAMLAAQSLGLKTINGYTARSPVEYSFFWDNLNEESRLRWFKYKKFDPDTLYVISYQPKKNNY